MNLNLLDWRTPWREDPRWLSAQISCFSRIAQCGFHNSPVLRGYSPLSTSKVANLIKFLFYSVLPCKVSIRIFMIFSIFSLFKSSIPTPASHMQDSIARKHAFLMPDDSSAFSSRFLKVVWISGKSSKGSSEHKLINSRHRLMKFSPSDSNNSFKGFYSAILQ